jgi:hypothetical protein
VTHCRQQCLEFNKINSVLFNKAESYVGFRDLFILWLRPGVHCTVQCTGMHTAHIAQVKLKYTVCPYIQYSSDCTRTTLQPTTYGDSQSKAHGVTTLSHFLDYKRNP